MHAEFLLNPPRQQYTPDLVKKNKKNTHFKRIFVCTGYYTILEVELAKVRRFEYLKLTVQRNWDCRRNRLERFRNEYKRGTVEVGQF